MRSYTYAKLAWTISKTMLRILRCTKLETMAWVKGIFQSLFLLVVGLLSFFSAPFFGPGFLGHLFGRSQARKKGIHWSICTMLDLSWKVSPFLIIIIFTSYNTTPKCVLVYYKFHYNLSEFEQFYHGETSQPLDEWGNQLLRKVNWFTNT